MRWAWRTRILVHLGVDLRMRLWQHAEDEAVRVFAANLRDLLLAAPAGARPTMGLDPGFRTGVKVAVTDGTGKSVATETIYPHEPRRRWDESVAILARLAAAHGVQLIAIGNGTASRETDRLAADLIKTHPELNLTKVVVSEAGASVYSASAFASRELPGMDVSLRGAVSIARRLQDPLAELVKIDPKSIGVGQYQHDISEGKLSRSLDAVVEDCVNAVGVDVNTASAPLLARVSGISAGLADGIVAHRDSAGPFRSRQALTTVPRLGPKAFEQSAGFLRITGGDDPLDASSVHPESYPVVRRILTAAGTPLPGLIGNTKLLRTLAPQSFADDRFGVPTVTDILRELEKPGRDPRPAFRTATFADGVETLADLTPGPGPRGHGHQRGRVRGVRRHRRAPGRAGARVRDVAELRLGSARGGQARGCGPGQGARRGHPAPADLPHPAAGRRGGPGPAPGHRAPQRPGPAATRPAATGPVKTSPAGTSRAVSQPRQDQPRKDQPRASRAGISRAAGGRAAAPRRPAARWPTPCAGPA